MGAIETPGANPGLCFFDPQKKIPSPENNEKKIEDRRKKGKLKKDREVPSQKAMRHSCKTWIFKSMFQRSDLKIMVQQFVRSIFRGIARHKSSNYLLSSGLTALKDCFCLTWIGMICSRWDEIRECFLRKRSRPQVVGVGWCRMVHSQRICIGPSRCHPKSKRAFLFLLSDPIATWRQPNTAAPSTAYFTRLAPSLKNW